MQHGLKVVGFGFLLAAGFAVSACGGEDGGGEPGSDGGTTSAGGSSAGSAGSSAGGTSASGGTGTAGTGGSTGGSASGGSAGTSASGTGGSAGAGSGGAGTSGGSGGTGDSGGSGGSGGGEPCTPASTEGIAFSGSCTSADLCSDQYDTSFGAEALEQLCAAQSGTWSTDHCTPTNWDKKCTQDVFGGVYVQYMPSDGICALGCEEAL